MGEIKEIYLSNDFDKEKSLLYELSMLFSKDSCFYMINRDKSVLLIKEISFSQAIDSSSETLDSLISIISNDPILQLDYYRIHIGLDTFKTILQPAELVVEGKEEILLKSVAKIYPVDFIVRENWDMESLVQITGVPQFLLNSLSNFFPDARINHLYKSLHDYISKNTSPIQNILVINLHTSHVNIFYYRNSKLILVNQFECFTEADVVYFASQIHDNFFKQPGKTHIYVCGKATFSTKNLISDLSLLFEKISFLNKTRINIDLVLNDYIDLYSLSQ